MYVTDATGLGIYDVTHPESPQIRSHVPLPRRRAAGAMHLVDVSDPAAPSIVDTRPAPGDLTVYDVRDLARPAPEPLPCTEELAWVADDDGTFGFDITDQARPRLVLGGPGDPRSGHWLLLGALTAPARGRGWPHRGAPVGFYVSTERFWGAYLAPELPASGVAWREPGRNRSVRRRAGRSASWGRGPVRSPSRGRIGPISSRTRPWSWSARARRARRPAARARCRRRRRAPRGCATTAGAATAHRPVPDAAVEPALERGGVLRLEAVAVRLAAADHHRHRAGREPDRRPRGHGSRAEPDQTASATGTCSVAIGSGARRPSARSVTSTQRSPSPRTSADGAAPSVVIVMLRTRAAARAAARAGSPGSSVPSSSASTRLAGPSTRRSRGRGRSAGRNVAATRGQPRAPDRLVGERGRGGQRPPPPAGQHPPLLARPTVAAPARNAARACARTRVRRRRRAGSSSTRPGAQHPREVLADHVVERARRAAPPATRR